MTGALESNVPLSPISRTRGKSEYQLGLFVLQGNSYPKLIVQFYLKLFLFHVWNLRLNLFDSALVYWKCQWWVWHDCWLAVSFSFSWMYLQELGLSQMRMSQQDTSKLTHFLSKCSIHGWGLEPCHQIMDLFPQPSSRWLETILLFIPS